MPLSLNSTHVEYRELGVKNGGGHRYGLQQTTPEKMKDSRQWNYHLPHKFVLQAMSEKITASTAPNIQQKITFVDGWELSVKPSKSNDNDKEKEETTRSKKMGVRIQNSSTTKEGIKRKHQQMKKKVVIMTRSKTTRFPCGCKSPCKHQRKKKKVAIIPC